MEEREREGGRERGRRKRGNNYGDSPVINSILLFENKINLHKWKIYIYVTVHAERDHKSAIVILRYGGVRQKRRILSFSIFFAQGMRSGDAEGFIESSQLFQSC